MQHTHRKLKFITVFVVCALLALSALYLTHRDTNRLNSESFHVEPLATVVPGWETTTDTVQGMTYMYPGFFGNPHVTTVDWPPTVISKRDGLGCVPTDGTDQTQQTVSRVQVEATEYCLTTHDEGAAGSTYRTYVYELEHGVTTVELSFTMQFVQCANYDEPEQTQCRTEQEGFDPNTTIHQIFNSMSFVERS